MSVVAAEAAQRAAQEALDRELMPPPAPPVTRRDILEQEERPVPKSPPKAPPKARATAPPQRPLTTIAAELNYARRMGRSTDAERLDNELCRKLATQCARTPTPIPSSAQEKYEVLRDIIQHWRNLERPYDEEFAMLDLEYRKQFPLISFQFDDPAAQMAADLGEYL